MAGGLWAIAPVSPAAPSAAPEALALEEPWVASGVLDTWKGRASMFLYAALLSAASAPSLERSNTAVALAACAVVLAGASATCNAIAQAELRQAQVYLKDCPKAQTPARTWPCHYHGQTNRTFSLFICRTYVPLHGVDTEYADSVQQVLQSQYTDMVMVWAATAATPKLPCNPCRSYTYAGLIMTDWGRSECCMPMFPDPSRVETGLASAPMRTKTHVGPPGLYRILPLTQMSASCPIRRCMPHLCSVHPGIVHVHGVVGAVEVCAKDQRELWASPHDGRDAEQLLPAVIGHHVHLGTWQGRLQLMLDPPSACRRQYTTHWPLHCCSP